MMMMMMMTMTAAIVDTVSAAMILVLSIGSASVLLLSLLLIIAVAVAAVFDVPDTIPRPSTSCNQTQSKPELPKPPSSRSSHESNLKFSSRALNDLREIPAGADFKLWAANGLIPPGSWALPTIRLWFLCRASCAMVITPHMGVFKNQGPSYRHQTSRDLARRTPRTRTPNYGKSHIKLRDPIPHMLSTLPLPLQSNCELQFPTCYATGLLVPPRSPFASLCSRSFDVN